MNSRTKPILRKTLTEYKSGDTLITTMLREELKEMVNRAGLRKVARRLRIDHASLYRSLNSDLRLSTVHAIASILGYDLKLLKRKEVKPCKSKLPRSNPKRKEVI